tara:strand:+ start:69212 stop:69799 length:588 start_codon:yes stop_codon:yes gene_type:complete
LTLKLIATTKLPTPWAEFDLRAFQDAEGLDHLCLSLGNLGSESLMRIHSQCLTGDALFSLRCDCGDQLETAMKQIASQGSGLIIYMAQEGRGIGLANKIKAYELQDAGLNTVEANRKLGFEDDERNYDVTGQILNAIGVSRVKLMTNNPKKIEGLERAGIQVVERIPIEAPANKINKSYIDTKIKDMGHIFKEKP